MIDFLLIAVCIIFGIFCQRYEDFRKFGPKILNGIIVNLCLPSLILAYIPGLGANYSHETVLFPAIMPWITFVFATFVLFSIGKIFGWKKKKTGLLILVTGLGNTSFMGLPMIEAIYGPKPLITCIIIDQLGGFMVVSTFATILAALCSGEHVSIKTLFKKLITFSPFVTLLAAFCMIPFGPFENLSRVLLKLGSPTIPLALITLGLQLKISVRELKKRQNDLICALLLKMLISPALILFLYVFLFKQRGETAQVIITEAAMAPMFSATIIANRFNLDPELGTLIIFVGALLSLVTVPIWAHSISWV